MTLNKTKFMALVGCLLVPLLFPKETIGMDNNNLEEKRTKVQSLLKIQRGSCIKTKNLFIAPYHSSDIEKYEEIQKNDSLQSGRHFHTKIPPDTLNGYLKAIADKKNLLSDPNYPFRFYSVYYLDPAENLKNKLIGFFGLSPLTMDMGMRNIGASNLNYIIDPSFRNKGFGKEMLESIVTDLVPPLLSRTYSIMSSTNEDLKDAPPMPFTQVRAFIDLENIPSLKIALKSGFFPFDLTVDNGKEYQIEFQFPKPNTSWISAEDQKLIENLSDPKIKDRFIKLCKDRTEQRKNEDNMFAQMFNGLLNSMGPKALGKVFENEAKK